MSGRTDPRPFWRRRLLVPLLVLLGGNLVALATFTAPRSWRERTAAERVTALRQAVAEQRAWTEALRERAATAAANARELELFYDEVVCRDGQARLELLEELERTVVEVGLAPERRSYSREPVPGAPLERIEVTLPASGSYRQLGALIDRLERSPHFVIVESVRLRQDPSGGVLDVVVSAYCRLAGAAA